MYKLRPYLCFKILQIKKHGTLGTIFGVLIRTPKQSLPSPKLNYKVVKRLSRIYRTNMETREQKHVTKPLKSKSASYSLMEFNLKDEEPECRKANIYNKANKLKENLSRITQKFYKKKQSELYLERNPYLPVKKRFFSSTYFLSHLSASTTLMRGIYQHPPVYYKYLMGFPAGHYESKRGYVSQKAKLKEVDNARGGKTRKNNSGSSQILQKKVEDLKKVDTVRWNKFVTSLVGENVNETTPESPNQDNKEVKETNCQMQDKETTPKVESGGSFIEDSELTDFRLDMHPEEEKKSANLTEDFIKEVIDKQDKATSTDTLPKAIKESKTHELIRRKSKVDNPERTVMVSMSKHHFKYQNELSKDRKEMSTIGNLGKESKPSKSEQNKEGSFDKIAAPRKPINHFILNKTFKDPLADTSVPSNDLELNLSDDVIKKYQSPIGENSYINEKSIGRKSNKEESKIGLNNSVTFNPPEQDEILEKQNESTNFQTKTDHGLKLELDKSKYEKDTEEVEDKRQIGPNKPGLSKSLQDLRAKPEPDDFHRTDLYTKRKDFYNPEALAKSPISSALSKKSSNQVRKPLNSSQNNLTGTKFQKPISNEISKRDKDVDESQDSTKEVIDNNLKKGLQKVLNFCHTLHRNYDSYLKIDKDHVNKLTRKRSSRESLGNSKDDLESAVDLVKKLKVNKESNETSKLMEHFLKNKSSGVALNANKRKNKLKIGNLTTESMESTMEKIIKSSAEGKSWSTMIHQPRNHTFNTLDQDRVRLGNSEKNLDKLSNVTISSAMEPLQKLAEQPIKEKLPSVKEVTEEKTEIKPPDLNVECKKLSSLLVGVNEKLKKDIEKVKEAKNEIKSRIDTFDGKSLVQELRNKYEIGDFKTPSTFLTSTSAKTDIRDEKITTTKDTKLLQAAKKLINEKKPQLIDNMQNSEIVSQSKSPLGLAELKAKGETTNDNSILKKSLNKIVKAKYPMLHNHRTSSRISTVTKKGDTLVLNITIKIPLDSMKPIKEKGTLRSSTIAKKRNLTNFDYEDDED